jgi:hypothetical protein
MSIPERSNVRRMMIPEVEDESEEAVLTKKCLRV